MKKNLTLMLLTAIFCYENASVKTMTYEECMQANAKNNPHSMMVRDCDGLPRSTKTKPPRISKVNQKIMEATEKSRKNLKADQVKNLEKLEKNIEEAGKSARMAEEKLQAALKEMEVYGKSLGIKQLRPQK